MREALPVPTSTIHVRKYYWLAAQVAFNIMPAHAKAVTAYSPEPAPAGEIGVVLNLTSSYTLTDSGRG
ncbi:hypothetical protein MJK72_22565 [Klebsiella pneumoniae]|nr:hypothetical protein MJK72_22565 [Klebsiella pneumoniae]